jgi:hypothetical protein
MTRKLTRITPVVNGYAVVVVQKQGLGSKPGEFLGCFVQTPESQDDGPMMLLAEAMALFIKHSDKPATEAPPPKQELVRQTSSA